MTPRIYGHTKVFKLEVNSPGHVGSKMVEETGSELL